MKLENKVAIVTGGANGIGRAISLGLAKEGANMVIADIDIMQAKAVAADVSAIGRKAISMAVDITKSEDTLRMAEKTLETFRSIDKMVNNAGGPTKSQSFFHDSSEEVWDSVIALNLKGMRNCTRAVINHMVNKRRGKIINIDSITGMVGTSLMVDYSTAKAVIIGFTMALAKEVAVYGINLNAISPGAILTKGLEMFPELREGRKKTTRFDRLGAPDEVASMAVFLASEESNYITGQNFPVCGIQNSSPGV
jgi:NAD(P)-dependent dehydrogenase (short-subunit alcohol dehydrogenase family)